MKSQMIFKTGFDGSKTRSVSQISEKPCVHSRCNIFSLILMKPRQKVYLNEIPYEFENMLCQVKN